MLSLPQSFTGPQIIISKLEGESSGLSEAEAFASVRSHLGLHSDTPFLVEGRWSGKMRQNRENRENISSPSSLFQQKSREWENGQLHVIVSQRMSAGSRDLTKIFSCKMAWSGHQKFCFISLMTWQWQWQFVGHLMVMCNIGLLLLCLKRNQIRFSKLK